MNVKSGAILAIGRGGGPFEENKKIFFDHKYVILCRQTNQTQ